MKKMTIALLCGMMIVSHAVSAQTKVEKMALKNAMKAEKNAMKAESTGASSYSRAYNAARQNGATRAQNAGQNREEIKAFQKMNKELLKQLKTKYNASSVEVNLTSMGEFLIVITCKKNGVTETYLTNDAGTPLYYEPVDGWSPFNNEKRVIAIQKGGKWGLANFKGELLIPLEYDGITFAIENEEGTSEGGIFHPANSRTFVTYSSQEGQVNFHDAEGAMYKTVKGSMESLNDYYLVIGTQNKKGLYTLDGKEIFPQSFYEFEVMGATGVIKTVNKDYATGLKSKGAKNIKPGTTDVIVPTRFQDVTWNGTTNSFAVSLHRNEPAVPFHPDSTYVITYKDDGVKCWDAANYEKVIEYYEGVGYGQPWGYYYMGMSAQALAEKERNDMERTIRTLKGDNYYMPIKYPDNYKFNYVRCLDMYHNAAMYYEEYINEEKVPGNDPTKVQARKMRGTMVTGEHEVKELYDEYTRLLTSASTKYAQHNIAIEQQRAAQAAQSAAISRGIGNIIGSFFK